MSTVPSPAESLRPFADSLTCRQLRSACLGEMHARRLYLHAARRMEEHQLYVIAHAFRFTAAQEKEHADIFRGLTTACGGAFLPMAEDAPLLLPRDPAEILSAVAQTEAEEAERLYPANARIAAEEGYPRIAAAFRRIGETEALHARRFRQYEAALADGTLFRDESPVSWLCLPCGQLHAGREAPVACSACGRDRGHFIRGNYHPFLVEG